MPLFLETKAKPECFHFANFDPSRTGVTGFPQHPKAPTQDEEQIYRALEDLVDDEHYEDFYYRHHGGGRGVGGLLHGGGAGGSQGVSGGSGGSRGKAGGSSQYYTALEQEEDIYEDLCSFKNQSSRRMQRELSFQPKEKRDHCIKVSL